MTMQTAPSIQDELYRKATDQLAHLLSLYEAGMIGTEGLKVGVETIWAVLGGVVGSEDFNDLMHWANQDVQRMPAAVHTKVLHKGDTLVVLMRSGTQTHMAVASNADIKTLTKTTLLEDEAVARINDMAASLHAKGFQENIL